MIAKLRRIDPFWWVFLCACMLAFVVWFEVQQPRTGSFEIEFEQDVTDNTTLRVVSIGGRRFVVVNGVNKVAVCSW